MHTQCVYRVVDRPRVRVEKRTHTRYTHHGLWGVPASVLRFKFIYTLTGGTVVVVDLPTPGGPSLYPCSLYRRRESLGVVRNDKTHKIVEEEKRMR